MSIIQLYANVQAHWRGTLGGDRRDPTKRYHGGRHASAQYVAMATQVSGASAGPTTPVIRDPIFPIGPPGPRHAPEPPHLSGSVCAGSGGGRQSGDYRRSQFLGSREGSIHVGPSHGMRECCAGARAVEATLPVGASERPAPNPRKVIFGRACANLDMASTKSGAVSGRVWAVPTKSGCGSTTCGVACCRQTSSHLDQNQSGINQIRGVR